MSAYIYATTHNIYGERVLYYKLWLENPQKFLSIFGVKESPTVATVIYNELWDVVIEVYPFDEPLGDNSYEHGFTRLPYLSFLDDGIPARATLYKVESQTYRDSGYDGECTLTCVSFKLGREYWHCRVEQLDDCTSIEVRPTIDGAYGWAMILPPTLYPTQPQVDEIQIEGAEITPQTITTIKGLEDFIKEHFDWCFFLDVTRKGLRWTHNWFVAHLSLDMSEWILTPLNYRTINAFGNRQERKQLDAPVTWHLAGKYWKHETIRNGSAGETYRIVKRDINNQEGLKV